MHLKVLCALGSPCSCWYIERWQLLFLLSDSNEGARLLVPVNIAVKFCAVGLSGVWDEVSWSRPKRVGVGVGFAWEVRWE